MFDGDPFDSGTPKYSSPVDDIGYLFKSYKKRCSTYKKNGYYFVEGVESCA